MARRARLNLDDLTVTRAAPAHAAPAAAEPAPGRLTGGPKDARRGQTLRLEPEAWQQLKMLAIAEGKTSHDLLIEAVNLLFDHYNRPTIAG
jgi:hypothetical protein